MELKAFWLQRRVFYRQNIVKVSLTCLFLKKLFISFGGFSISNGNRTEWSPIRSVIIRVITKSDDPRSGSPICLSRV